jgi:hypothetical protein
MRHAKWVSLAIAVPLALVLATMFVVRAATVNAAPPNPFVGAWESTDVDGSHQTLAIGGSAQASHVHLFDDAASVCNPPLQRPAEGSGVGQVSGSDLTVTLTVYCLQPHEFFVTREVIYTYDSASNTLTDSFGVVWHRH